MEHLSHGQLGGSRKARATALGTGVNAGALSPETFSWGFSCPTSEGPGHQLLCLLIMLCPPSPFPSSFALANLLNSVCALLKMKGTDEAQPPANRGVSARPQNPTHTWGQQEGWETEPGPPSWIQHSPIS